MYRLLVAIAGHVSVFASVVSLYVSIAPITSKTPLWHLALLGFSLLVTGCLVGYEIWLHVMYSPKTFKEQKKINAYMRKWVSGGGRVVIFSRDLSWVESGETRDLLFSKAQRNELTICLEHPIALADQLRTVGARIVYYGGFGHVPKSRFTIVDFEREGARVAIGIKDGAHHKIQEFRSGSHPSFTLAEDMVKLIIGTQGQ